MQSEIIQIHSIEASDYGVKINATDKRVFNVSKEKKDGTLSNAWEQMVEMGLKGLNPTTNSPGAVVEAWYDEVPNKYGGTSRYIKSFKEAGNRSVGPIGEPTPTKSLPGADSGSTRVSNDAFGRRLAIHGFINGLLASGVKPEEITVATLKQLNGLENVVDAFLASGAMPEPLADAAAKSEDL